MLDKKLKEALDLVGGKAILKDQEQYYVLMSLNEFKKLRQMGIEGLTKQELIDKINNDIASWKFVQEEKKMEEIELEEIELEEIELEEMADIKESEEMRYEKAA